MPGAFSRRLPKGISGSTSPLTLKPEIGPSPKLPVRRWNVSEYAARILSMSCASVLDTGPCAAVATEDGVMEGVVNAALEAVVPLRIQGPEGRTQEVRAVVDTGYSGFLTLPTGLVVELGLPFAYMGQALLANDTEVDFDVHYATVLWDDQPRDIEADATGSTPLIGMLLLDGHGLEIQVRDGGRVLIQDTES